jgi:hypothetical protein
MIEKYYRDFGASQEQGACIYFNARRVCIISRDFQVKSEEENHQNSLD